MYWYFRDTGFDRKTGRGSEGIMDLKLPVEGTTSVITGPKRNKGSICNNIWTQV